MVDVTRGAIPAKRSLQTSPYLKDMARFCDEKRYARYNAHHSQYAGGSSTLMFLVSALSHTSPGNTTSFPHLSTLSISLCVSYRDVLRYTQIIAQWVFSVGVLLGVVYAYYFFIISVRS